VHVDTSLAPVHSHDRGFFYASAGEDGTYPARLFVRIDDLDDLLRVVRVGSREEIQEMKPLKNRGGSANLATHGANGGGIAIKTYKL
jgi:hypothetical protein